MNEQLKIISFRVPVSLIERLKNAAYWKRYTINSVGIDAVNAEVKRLERVFNNDVEFSPRPEK